MVGLPPAPRAPSPLPRAPAGWVGLSPGAGACVSAPPAGGGGHALLGCAIKGLPWFSSCCLLLFLGSLGHPDPNLHGGRHRDGKGRAACSGAVLDLQPVSLVCAPLPLLPSSHHCCCLSPPPMLGSRVTLGVFLHLLQLVLAFSSSLGPGSHHPPLALDLAKWREQSLHSPG